MQPIPYDKLTLYDALGCFRTLFPDPSFRHHLEGGVVLGNLFHVAERDTARLRSVPSIYSKSEQDAILARRVYDFAKGLLNEDKSNLESIASQSLNAFSSAFHLDSLEMPPIRAQNRNLSASVLKLARYRHSVKASFTEVGERLEEGIKSTAELNGLVTPDGVEVSPDRSFETVSKVRAVEYETLARIVHSVYCANRAR